MRRKRPPPIPAPTPDGYIWAKGTLVRIELVQWTHAQRMAKHNHVSFRQLDTGNDYDLAARTKARRERS